MATRIKERDGSMFVKPLIGFLTISIFLGIGIALMPNSEEKSQFRIDIENVLADYDKGKINCDYIRDLKISDKSYVLSNSVVKEKLRTYWNAYSCGYEWNWWD